MKINLEKLDKKIIKILDTYNMNIMKTEYCLKQDILELKLCVFIYI